VISPSVGDRIDGTLEAAARGLPWILALLIGVFAFVAFQDRIDRRDPKLALAPVESDIVRFE
jgi:hypothetical protein